MGLIQRCNLGDIFGATSAMLGRICPSDKNRVKVADNLGATAVTPVAPAVRSPIIKFIYSEKATKFLKSSPYF